MSHRDHLHSSPLAAWIGTRLLTIVRQGTTFSGVAFAFATNTEAKEDIIVEWPGAGTQTKQKVDIHDYI